MRTSKKANVLAALSFAIAAMSVSGSAVAQQPTLIDQFNDWAAYSVDSENGKVCYVASQPKNQQPSGVNRDPVFFMISHWQGRDVRNEASVIIGYPFAENSKLVAEIDGDSFSMFTKGDGAWIENVAEETRLVEAMKAGRQMVVTGQSRRGTTTTDTYSLSGVTAAIRRIDSVCG
ncbi:MAG: invasion associated locus B family protein [Pseudomonadota bacterium]